MTEAAPQAQGQATPEANDAQVTQQDAETLTREDHIRELQRVGKKEKAEGYSKRDDRTP